MGSFVRDLDGCVVVRFRGFLVGVPGQCGLDWSGVFFRLVWVTLVVRYSGTVGVYPDHVVLTTGMEKKVH